jgi:DNA repair exonuclease SbcCD ATPase subunit
MGDFIIRLSAIAVAAAAVARIALVPLARLVGRLVDQISEVRSAVDDLPKLDAGLAELAQVRKSIDSGLKGMQRIVAGGEERLAALEAEWAEWRNGHIAAHQLLETRVHTIEHQTAP